MTQKDKKQKGKRKETNIGRRTGSILEIIKLDYIAKILCWCGETILIDSSKPITENICPQCKSPYKLMDWEWTAEEQNKFIQAKGL